MKMLFNYDRSSLRTADRSFYPVTSKTFLMCSTQKSRPPAWTAFVICELFLRTHYLDHNGFLCMKSVFSFLEYLICVSLEYLFCYLLLTVSRQTVLNHCVSLCNSHDIVIYLIALECDRSFSSLSQLPRPLKSKRL